MEIKSCPFCGNACRDNFKISDLGSFTSWECLQCMAIFHLVNGQESEDLRMILLGWCGRKDFKTRKASWGLPHD